MKTLDIYALGMAAVVVSFLGFVVENLWLCVEKGYMDNRNMFFPFLIGYGIAMILIFLLFGTPKKLWFLGKASLIKSRIAKWIVYFIGVLVCICVGEILLGKTVEKTCHFYWWDYSDIPFHITRYTSIPTSILFSAGVTVFMDVCLEPLYNYFHAFDAGRLKMIVLAFAVLLIFDFAYNAYKMYQVQGMVRRWRLDTTGSRIYKRLHV